MLKSGDVFQGRYRILRELGRGGYADVYLGQHVEIDQLVAIKVLRRTDADPRFVREGKILATLRSPYTVRILDFGRVEGTGVSFMIFEYVDGEPLGQVRRRGPLPWEEALDIVRQILESLAEAHALGVIHRDIKPDNVMRLPDRTIKVLDFGIARTSEPGGTITGTNMVVGTPRYMPPEALLGSKYATPAVDVFAVGLIAYGLLTGERANTGRTTDEIVAHQLSQEAYRLPDNVAVPGAVREWVELMCRKDPAERPPDASTALEALAALDAVVNPEAPPPAAPPNGRRAMMLAAAIGVAAIIAISLGMKLRSDRPAVALPADTMHAESPRERSTEPAPPESSVESPESDAADAALTRGLDAFATSDWIGALTSFHEVQAHGDTAAMRTLQNGEYVQRSIDALVAEPRRKGSTTQIAELRRAIELYPTVPALQTRLAKFEGSVPSPTPRRTSPTGREVAKSPTGLEVVKLDDLGGKSNSADESYTKAVKAMLDADYGAALKHGKRGIKAGCGKKCYRIVAMAHHKRGEKAQACSWFKRAGSDTPADLRCD